MSKFFNLTNTKNYIFKKWTKRLDFTHWRILIITLIIFLGIFYLTQIHKNTARGYEIRELEQKIETLKEVNKNLEFKKAEFQSMKSLKSRLEHDNMVTVAKIEYINASGTIVAVK